MSQLMEVDIFLAAYYYNMSLVMLVLSFTSIPKDQYMDHSKSTRYASQQGMVHNKTWLTTRHGPQQDIAHKKT